MNFWSSELEKSFDKPVCHINKVLFTISYTIKTKGTVF